MIEQPRIKAHLDVAVVDDDKVFLSNEGAHYLVEGRAANAVAGLLDGSRQLDEVLADLPRTVGLGPVMAAIDRLGRAGHVASGPATDDAGATAWWDLTGVPPAEAVTALRQATVVVRSLGAAQPAPVTAALHAAGVRVVDGPDDDTRLGIVVVDDYLDPGLDAVNRRMLDDGHEWLLCRVAGEQVHIGPHLRPGRSACWRCLAHRLSGNRQLDRYLDTKVATTWRRPATSPALPSTTAMAAAMVATEVVTILVTGASPRLADGLLTFDPVDFTTASHHVVKRPQCPTCGVLPEGPAAPVVLGSAPKVFVDDGGHRTERPEATYARLAKHVSPLTGAVSALTRQTLEDDGVAYTYVSGHNFALMQDSTYFLRKNMRGRSGGKGRTDVQAKVGAICEAIERYAGVFRGDEPRRRASYTDLVAEGAAVVAPGELLLFSDRQYDARQRWNGRDPGYHVVPERFDEHRAVDWTTAWSLRDGAPRHVPTAYCYFGHPDIAEHFFCASDANGNAAGNGIEEAVLQGLLELVERDAVALWWYPRARRPAVDLDALAEPYVDAVREQYDRLDRSVWMLDLTTDLGIPVYAAVSRRRSGPTEDILLGFGAHTDPRMAALRALTELNQFLPGVGGRRDDGTTIYLIDDPQAVEWWTTATIANVPYVLPDPSAPAVDPARYAGLATADLALDVGGCVERIAAAGHDVMVVDQTRPDIELSVVKVMAPGLRHFWRRLAPGRLYDVPRRLGWVDDVSEDDLNPSSIFF